MSNKQVVHRTRFVDFTPGNITALAFSHKSSEKLAPNDLRLAVGRSNGNIEIWNPRDNWVQEFLIQGGEGRSIEGLCWCNIPGEPARLFSIGGSTAITEWNLETGLPLTNYNCNGGVIWSLAISEKGDKLAVGCDNGGVVIVSIAGGRGVLEHEMILSRQDSRILSVTWAKNDEYIVGGCSDGRVRIWCSKVNDENRGRLQHTMKVDKSKKESTLVWSVMYLAKQNQIVSGDSTGTVKFWDLTYATLSQTFKVHDADILALSSNLNNTQLFTAGVDRKIFQFSYIDTGKSSKWISTSNRLFHSNDVRSMCAYQCKGFDFLVSGGVEKSLVLSSMKSFSEGNYRKMPLVTPFHKSVLINRTQRLVVMWQDNTIKIWIIGNDLNDAKNYKLVSKLSLKDEHNVQTCALSPDGQVLLVGRLTTTKIFHLHQTASKLKITKLDNAFLLKTGCKLAKFIDNSKVLLCTEQDELLSLDLEDEDESITKFQLPDVAGSKTSLKFPYLSTISHLEVKGDYAVVARGCGSVELINLKDNSAKQLIRMNNFISAVSISSRFTAIVVTSENKIFEFNIDPEKDQLLTDWYKINGENLPQQFTDLVERCVGIFNDELNENKIWFWGSNWLANFDMSFDLPVNRRKKAKKHGRDGLTIVGDTITNSNDEEDDEEEDEEFMIKEGFMLKGTSPQDIQSNKRSEKAFFLLEKYKPLIFVDKMSEEELLVVERPNFLISQPPAFELEKLIF